VASYPKILPKNILDLARLGSLNVHPSILPKYRGPSPIQTALLNDDINSGISIIKLDEEIDHGPILIQKEFNIKNEDTFSNLEVSCGIEGGEMLAMILPSFLEGSLKLKDQDHDKATFTKKFSKIDGEINLESTSALELQNKFRAFTPHIPIYFFINHNDKEIRVKITEINFDKDFAMDKITKDIIKKLIPENKSEMSFEDFERGYL
jgi:methionyl-tRNA formyltransferase